MAAPLALAQGGSDIRCTLVLSSSVPLEGLTGRAFLLVAKHGEGEEEPRLRSGPVSLFGVNADKLTQGGTLTLDSRTAGFSERSLADLAPGDYDAQAVFNVYTAFRRADGHTIWAHTDQGEGQNFRLSPGNLISTSQRIHIAANARTEIRLSLDRTIPPIRLPADTPWVKRIRIQSALLTRFWGHPMYLSATILLPRGYAEHPDMRYPVIYLHGHYGLGPPFGFEPEPDPPGARSWARLRSDWAAAHPREAAAGHLNLPEWAGHGIAENLLEGIFEWDGSLPKVESGREFYEAWTADDFPRMIAISCQYPTPYGDSAGAVNSANCGPYGDALMQELIPYLETHFRVIREPYARILTGGSWGGWISLALQVYHPDFYGGVWSFAPGFGVDFRRYQGVVDLYEDDNAYSDALEWRCPGAIGSVAHIRDWDRSRMVRGMPLDEAVKTPVGPDGYPLPIWDHATGKIDRAVVRYMREHDYDLRDYLERNWPRIGSQLVGKLHVICGDQDAAYVQFGVYLLEDFLEETTDPYYGGSFTYGRPMKSHCWTPYTNAELVRLMAKFVASRAPRGTQPVSNE